MSQATASAPVDVIYTAPTGKRTAGRIHRATCRHIPKGASRLTPAAAGPDALLEATRATCCSVREADRSHAVNTARSAEMDASMDGGQPASAPGNAEVAITATAPAEAGEAPARLGSARKQRTFDAGSVTEYACEGTCGETKPVRSFPTAGSSTKRGVECRACRDARLGAAKDAAAA